MKNKRFVICADYYGTITTGIWDDNTETYEMGDGDCLREDQLE